MTVVATTCPTCHLAADLPIGTVLVDVSDTGPGGPDRGSVWWVCLACADVVGLSVARPVLLALGRGGAAVLDSTAT